MTSSQALFSPSALFPVSRRPRSSSFPPVLLLPRDPGDLVADPRHAGLDLLLGGAAPVHALGQVEGQPRHVQQTAVVGVRRPPHVETRP